MENKKILTKLSEIIYSTSILGDLINISRFDNNTFCIDYIETNETNICTNSGIKSLPIDLKLKTHHDFVDQFNIEANITVEQENMLASIYGIDPNDSFSSAIVSAGYDLLYKKFLELYDKVEPIKGGKIIPYNNNIFAKLYRWFLITFLKKKFVYSNKLLKDITCYVNELISKSLNSNLFVIVSRDILNLMENTHENMFFVSKETVSNAKISKDNRNLAKVGSFMGISTYLFLDKNIKGKVYVGSSTSKKHKGNIYPGINLAYRTLDDEYVTYKKYKSDIRPGETLSTFYKLSLFFKFFNDGENFDNYKIIQYE